MFNLKELKMNAVEIKKDIYWVGVKDWNLKEFHGYSTPNGSTYNSYLIMDEKITLVDGVKHYMSHEKHCSYSKPDRFQQN